MLQILAFLLLTGAAVDISWKVYINRAVFAEHGLRTSIGWLVWLYPVPFFLPFLSKWFFAFLLFRIPAGALFFVPGLISAKANQKLFERSGDDRVKPALAVANTALCAGIMGLMGVLLISMYIWILFPLR